MSFELNYFPPKCGKHEWHQKVLAYSCWSLGISEKLRELRIPEIASIWPMNITCNVDIADGKYWWLVSATDWEFRRSETKGWVDTAEDAICKAEEVGERYWEQLVQGWMVEALQNGWRPSSISSIVCASSPKAFSLKIQDES
jgi:hypothetical protein